MSSPSHIGLGELSDPEPDPELTMETLDNLIDQEPAICRGRSTMLKHAFRCAMRANIDLEYGDAEKTQHWMMMAQTWIQLSTAFQNQE